MSLIAIQPSLLIMGFYELALLLTLILPLCPAQSTYYVTPTPETPCPAESCLSFVEYTRQGTKQLENATLVFLPGTHSIDSSIELGNLTSLTLLGDSSSLPQVTSRILCSQRASVSFQYVEKLFISTLGFVSCGTEADDYHGAAVVAEVVQNLTIANCLFQDNNNLNGFNGGALAVIFSTVDVSQTTFERNSASYGGAAYIRNSIVSFTGNSFVSNVGRINGGAVFVHSGVDFLSLSSLTSVDFTENLFSHNSGGGAVVFADDPTVLTFTDNEFTNNTGNVVYGSSTPQPSVYYVTPTPDVPCPGNPCHTLSEYVEQAGQFFTMSTTLKFLPGNHSLRSRLLVSGIDSLTLEGDPSLPTQIICSTLKSTGFEFQHMTQLYISELIFDSCGGDNAASAALLLQSIGRSEVSNSTIKGTEFSQREIDISRTSAFAVLDSTLILTGSMFEENLNAVGNGGGVYAENSFVSITGSRFINNCVTSSLRRGGGVALYGTTAYLTGNRFENNCANFGGGASISTGSVGNFVENSFINNDASFGGGVAVISSRASFVNNTFVKNTAAADGGGVNGGLDSLMEFNGNTFIDNSAVNGGAVTVKGSSTADFTDNTFINNSNSDTWAVEIDTASMATFTGNSFINGTGYAIYGSTVDTPSVYYVKPSPDTPCPESPCNTLSEYLEQAGQYFTSNTTLMLLSGDHVLEGKLLVRDISALTLIGRTVDGNSTTSSATRIICTYKQVFLHFQNITEVTINSVDFVSCGDANASAVTLLAVLRSSISNCTFLNCTGGALSITRTDTIVLTHSSFIDNTSPTFGGAIHLDLVNKVIITSNNFTDNFAGGAGGAVDIVACTVTFEGDTFLLRNSADGSGGAIFIGDSTVLFNGKTHFSTNSGQLLGGAIAIANSSVNYREVTTFINNTANSGGGIEAKDSFLIFQQRTVFQNNSAILNGGAIYAISSNISIHERSTFVNNSATYGGAVYTVLCLLNVQGDNIFMKNTALRDGGGLLLTSDSKYYLGPNVLISFESNTAERNGGAIKVDVSNLLVYCLETFLTSALNQCFFQFNSKTNIQYSRELDVLNVRMDFNNNSAGEGGNDIYGGALDNCGLQNVAKCCDFRSSGSVLDYITGNMPETLLISSDPLRICMCENNEANCNSSSLTRRAYPGGNFIVSVIAFGQRNGRVSAVVQADLIQGNIIFGSLQYIQNTSSTCTDIEYTVFSSEEETQEDITLHVQGPCPREGRSLALRVEVLLCPHAFELSGNLRMCVCSNRLEGFTDTCAIENGTILRQHDAGFWVGFSNESDGLILHPRCPFDYCTSEELFVSVDSSNVQCNYNRSGKLCGECIRNLSLVLGSSRCLQCSNSHLALLVAFAFAGIALVFVLFVLKLTVAVGTINGLIFYANVLQVNSTIFFQPGTTNILTIFIAWLNLDLGIETCFYDGMNAYAKTWLQFLFPVYVWALVGIIIFSSHFSQKISSLLGKNPIAVLCTLFLLSYAQVLRTIIAALSFTFLEYPNGRQTVWIHNGNIGYFTGGHVPLFLVALSVLLLLFLPYNLLLFCGQWIQGRSESRAFSWINRPSIKSFLDAYHAPYADKHRYWTGLLLLTRSGLFLIFAFNALGDPDVNLFCITTVTLGIITIGFIAERIYANQYIGALEASFIINLGVLSVATTSFRRGNQAALTYTSVSIAFVTFIGIVTYHSYLQGRDTYNEIRKKFAYLTRDSFRRKGRRHNLNVKDIGKPMTVPTRSVVSLREPLLEDCNS